MLKNKKARERFALCSMGAIAAAMAIGAAFQFGDVFGITALADSAQSLMTIILQILMKLITVLGVIFGIMGVVHYASANSEGDGPAKNKAMAQIAAGVMLLLVSILGANKIEDIVALITEQ